MHIEGARSGSLVSGPGMIGHDVEAMQMCGVEPQ